MEIPSLLVSRLRPEDDDVGAVRPVAVYAGADVEETCVARLDRPAHGTSRSEQRRSRAGHQLPGDGQVPGGSRLHRAQELDPDVDVGARERGRCGEVTKTRLRVRCDECRLPEEPDLALRLDSPRLLERLRDV